jgi:acetoin utilization protein AcuB
MMIVREVMTTRLVLVTPETTLSHAANLLRQYQFHHLPVVRMPARSRQWTGASGMVIETRHSEKVVLPLFEGLLTSQDIDLAAAVAAEQAERVAPGGALPTGAFWQEQPVRNVMQESVLTVTPSTSLAAATHLLVERGLNCLPVVEYDDEEGSAHEARILLVGLLTRSDLLIALARLLGEDEPGVDVHLLCPAGNLTPLAKTLLLAAEMHIAVRSSFAAPLEGGIPYSAIVRLGTIHPAPLLTRLREAGISYTLAGSLPEGTSYV